MAHPSPDEMVLTGGCHAHGGWGDLNAQPLGTRFSAPCRDVTPAGWRPAHTVRPVAHQLDPIRSMRQDHHRTPGSNRVNPRPERARPFAPGSCLRSMWGPRLLRPGGRRQRGRGEPRLADDIVRAASGLDADGHTPEVRRIGRGAKMVVVTRDVEPSSAGTALQPVRHPRALGGAPGGQAEVGDGAFDEGPFDR